MKTNVSPGTGLAPDGSVCRENVKRTTLHPIARSAPPPARQREIAWSFGPGSRSHAPRSNPCCPSAPAAAPSAPEPRPPGRPAPRVRGPWLQTASATKIRPEDGPSLFGERNHVAPCATADVDRSHLALRASSAAKPSSVRFEVAADPSTVPAVLHGEPASGVHVIPPVSRSMISSIRDGSAARTACGTLPISTIVCGVARTSWPPIVSVSAPSRVRRVVERRRVLAELFAGIEGEQRDVAGRRTCEHPAGNALRGRGHERRQR